MASWDVLWRLLEVCSSVRRVRRFAVEAEGSAVVGVETEVPTGSGGVGVGSGVGAELRFILLFRWVDQTDCMDRLREFGRYLSKVS